MPSSDRFEELRQLGRMRAVSYLEGSTLLLLLGIAVPLKHFAGCPIATAIMGPAHGLAFVVYVWMLVQTWAGGEWSRADILRMFLAALIPFGAFWNERMLARRQASLTVPA